MSRRRDPDSAWHLDKKIPVAIIIALLAQTAGAIWWASATNQRLTVLEEKQATSTRDTPVQSERLTRVETKVETIQRDVTEIKSDIKGLVRNSSGAR